MQIFFQYPLYRNLKIEKFQLIIVHAMIAAHASIQIIKAMTILSILKQLGER
jgi:ABC-type lipoprotein release transport system permease subunit